MVASEPLLAIDCVSSGVDAWSDRPTYGFLCLCGCCSQRKFDVGGFYVVLDSNSMF